MREILEDAASIYRQELDNLFALLIAAVLLGPILLIISTRGLLAALVVTPLLFVLYLATYAACLHWAGHQLGINPAAPMPTGAFLLRRSVDIVLAAAQPALLLLGATVAGLVLADRGLGYMWWLFAGAAAGLVSRWAYGHMLDLPLVVAYAASAREAAAASYRFDSESRRNTLRLLCVAGAPMALVALLGLWLALAFAPVAGVALFLLAGTAWLPFAALTIAGACERTLRQAELASRQAAFAARQAELAAQQPVERTVVSAMPARR